MKRKRHVIPFLLLLAAIAVFVARPRPEVTVDDVVRAQAIDALAAGLDQYYVFPDKAKQMVALLRKRQKDGAYDGIANGVKLAAQLEADLASVAHDRHMGVTFSLRRLPPQPLPAPITQAAALKAPRASSNVVMRWIERIGRSMEKSGVEMAIHLSPKIGYLKISEFPSPDLTSEKYAAAMNKLADTDALIIDLRDNRGGDPLSVALLISYFVDQRTRLNDIWERASGETAQFWTQDELDGKRYGGRKPVLILAGPGTASAGEDFTYTMQALKRATVIGEPTWGGAHPVMFWRLGDHLHAAIPNARSISPITHSNWEGTGVIPDVAAPRAEAFALAKTMLQARTNSRNRTSF
jgi:hypothetical protein